MLVCGSFCPQPQQNFVLQPEHLQQHHQHEHLEGLRVFVPSAMQQPAQRQAVRPQGATVVSASTPQLQAYPPAVPWGSRHIVAAADLLDAVVAGGAGDHAIALPELLQALFCLLLSNFSLVFVAALVAVPLHTALPAPSVPACIADQRWAHVLCDHMLETLPACLVLALRTSVSAVQDQSHGHAMPTVKKCSLGVTQPAKDNLRAEQRHHTQG